LLSPIFLIHGDNLRNQIFPVAQALSHLSQGTTLLPGTIVMTGTPAGVGYARNPPIILQHGDTVEVSIGGGIGTLVNKVVEERK
jgi:2-keto-4-pentenoate hydratase/2-oxohepta-3-ene-1,7-dioic acid hydratase in catechol pathway